ncbi:MAG TPA: hypothetical protein VL527_02240 [Dongiaceae bacterium]|jgi:hypothetical protein|nr:hypothetical protein [Dongiaceae bacterium]
MPIYINLLAEAKAEEELRRRDPVKRAIWIGVFLVCLMLAWSSTLQIRIMTENGQLNNLEGGIQSQNKDYDAVISHGKQLVEVNNKLVALNQLSTNRFLWATVLNALQQSTIKNVQLTAFRTEQTYTLTEAVKMKKNEEGKITTPGHPAYTTEKITILLDAKDASATPGDQVGKYKAALAGTDFFQQALNRNEIALRNLSPPVVDAESGKTVVMFTLECRLPDRILK